MSLPDNLGPVIVGFTGTRKGMTAQQVTMIQRMLRELEVVEVHHGCCVGADEQMHDLAHDAELVVVMHPPKNRKLRSTKIFSGMGDRVMEPRPYLDRNKDIVIACDLLIAAPKERDEPYPARGQGTWSTVRYARKDGCMLRIVWP